MKDKAIKLKNEHRIEYMFYSDRKKSGFKRRVENLLCKAVEKNDDMVIMICDHIITRIEPIDCINRKPWRHLK